jgi:peptidyl-prolyl cis-trans isomerase C
MTSFFRNRPSILSRLTSLFVLLPILAAVLLSGCGGGGDDAVVATVGDREITKTYYEDRLSKLKLEDLPRDADGLPVDTGTYDGKAAFLDVIVNKELMALKSYDLGFGIDDKVSQTRSMVTEFVAGSLMHDELIKAPAQNITEADIDDYYSKLGTQRDYHFIICNFRDDAVKAREKLLGGASWEDVAEEYSDGSNGPNQDYTLRMQFGHVEDVFEEAMFTLETGEISQPIETVYGYWLLRLDAVSDVRAPAMDDALREKIRDTLVARAVNLIRTKFIEESRARHEFTMDETSLWIIFQGMPEQEILLDPVTRQPTPKSELLQLDVPMSDLSRVFYTIKFDLEGELETWTIGDYKNLYDQMSVFQRPKRSELLGSVRKKIISDMVDKKLLVSESRERGYFEHEDVVSDAVNRAEQAMITKLHDEVVTYREQITPEELEEFWQDHKAEYVNNEVRSGLIVFTLDEATAAAARVEIEAGTSWKAVLDKYGANPENKAVDGVVDVNSNATGPVHETLYTMTETGTLSQPFPVQGGWAVARLEKITPSSQMEYEEVLDPLGSRIKSIRKNEALNALLAQWTLEYGVEINDDALSSVRSWEELTSVQ